jgi:hypothetical protein
VPAIEKPGVQRSHDAQRLYGHLPLHRCAVSASQLPPELQLHLPRCHAWIGQNTTSTPVRSHSLSGPMTIPILPPP